MDTADLATCHTVEDFLALVDRRVRALKGRGASATRGTTRVSKPSMKNLRPRLHGGLDPLLTCLHIVPHRPPGLVGLYY